MKKFILPLLTILFFQTAMSQDIKKVRSAFDKKDWAKAKEAVDLYVTSEKGASDWEGWYYKGMIYTQLAKNTGENSEAWIQSLEAYKKASQLDAKQVTNFMTIRNFPIFENYQALYQYGYDLYAKNDFKNAVITFLQADQVGRYIYQNNWALSELDTALVFMIGYTYFLDNKPEQSVTYFKQIADKEITGKDYDICYSSLAYYYDNIGDIVNSDRYANLGRRLYPEDPYYDKLDLIKESKNGSGPKLFPKYEKVILKDPNNYDIRYEYAYEMFNWLYSDPQATKEEIQKIRENINDQLNACIKINNSNTEAYILLGNSYYNDAVNLQDSYNKIKGTSSSDQDKKKAIKENMNSYINESIKSLEIAVALFEKMPKDNFKNDRRLNNMFKNTLNTLSKGYLFIGNTEKSQYYEKKEQGIQ